MEMVDNSSLVPEVLAVPVVLVVLLLIALPILYWRWARDGGRYRKLLAYCFIGLSVVTFLSGPFFIAAYAAIVWKDESEFEAKMPDDTL